MFVSITGGCINSLGGGVTIKRNWVFSVFQIFLKIFYNYDRIKKNKFRIGIFFDNFFFFICEMFDLFIHYLGSLLAGIEFVLKALDMIYFRMFYCLTYFFFNIISIWVSFICMRVLLLRYMHFIFILLYVECLLNFGKCRYKFVVYKGLFSDSFFLW